MAYVSAGLSRTGGEETIHDACNDEEFGKIWIKYFGSRDRPRTSGFLWLGGCDHS